MLYALASAFGKGFGNHFVMLAVLLFILGPIIQQPPGIASLQIGLHRWPMVVGIMVRWAILLALLLAIGYVTKFSDAFSRRVLLTWAILTPASPDRGAAGSGLGAAAPDAFDQQYPQRGVRGL